MRYFIPSLLVTFIFIGCTSDTGPTMELFGTVKGLKKGTLLLQKFEDSILTTVDSIEIDRNPEFHFSRKIESPEIYFLQIQLDQGALDDGRITFFGEAGELNIKANLENFGSTAKVSGSKNDSLLNDYNKLKNRYVSQNLDLIERQLKLRGTGNDSLLNNLRQQKERLLTNRYFATINFALNHKDYEIAPYLMLSETPDSNLKYLDTVYNSLSPKIKNSKYGKELESFIKIKKQDDTPL